MGSTGRSRRLLCLFSVLHLLHGSFLFSGYWEGEEREREKPDFRSCDADFERDREKEIIIVRQKATRVKVWRVQLGEAENPPKLEEEEEEKTGTDRIEARRRAT